MRILFIGKYEQSEILSGPGKVAKRIFEQISSSCQSQFWEYYFDGNVFSLRDKLFGCEMISAEGSQVMRLGIFAIFRQLIAFRPSIVHIITFERIALLFLLARPFFGYRICYNVHGIIRYEHNLRKKYIPGSLRLKDFWTEKLLYLFSDKLLFLSEQSISLASEYFSFDKKKVCLIRNGIDDIFRRTPDKPAIPGSPLKLVIVADYERKEKGLPFLLNALKNISVPVELSIIGQIDNISGEISALPFICNVYNKLATEKYAELLMLHDVYISSSSYEPFNISSFEAMASGLVPVLTKETGSSAFIQNYENGIIYDYGDSKALITILEQLYHDAFLRERLKKSASEIFCKNSWTVLSEDYRAIYMELNTVEK